MLGTQQGTVMILGGDGYLGWSLGLAFAQRTGQDVVLVDSLVKRRWEAQVGAKLLVPIKRPRTRVAAYRRSFGQSNLTFERANLLDYRAVVRMLRRYRPRLVINAAQQPSAPFSMMNPGNAALTFRNNLTSHLNVVWAIAEVDSDIACLKLGSAGCYQGIDTDFVPLRRQDFRFEAAGGPQWVRDSFLPMRATDFYHQSKISDFMIDDLGASVWGLKLATIQQATIFGATIAENHAPDRVGLAARYNYDAVFGTVVNRFVCQAALGHPITVYGDGTQATGLVSLSDAVDNCLRLSEVDLPAGEHTVVHNLTHRLTVREIAEEIARLEPSAQISHLDNPRTESVTTGVTQVEIHPAIQASQADKDARLREELARTLDYTKRHRANIDPAIIMPTVPWRRSQPVAARRVLPARSAGGTGSSRLRARVTAR